MNTRLENLENYNEEVVDLTKSHGKVMETYVSWKTASVDFRVLTMFYVTLKTYNAIFVVIR